MEYDILKSQRDELLAACEELVEAFGGWWILQHGLPYERDALERARKAIAKAKGE